MNLKKTNIALLLVSLGTGTAATLGSNEYISNQVRAYKARVDAEYEKVKVVVAKDDLPSGVVMTGAHVALREVPKAFLHADSIVSDRWNQYRGFITDARLTKGAPVLQSQLRSPYDEGVSYALEAGKRALTIPVDQVSSLSGLLEPGNRVDILLSLLRRATKSTVVLMSDIPILATGNATEFDRNGAASARGYNTVTLLVTPDQAAKLVHAREEGSISVVLRSDDDQDELDLDKVTLASLLNEPAPVKKRRTPPKPDVEVIRGGQQGR